ncbi:putative TPX2 family protein [Hibiscus syriacus]|uniref:TPX2 family protein n=1 Tax=Hibiscus syriacus TaxID=106335 RepID=A0A6A3CNM4_HIBSY|nr:basic salivary proline-rich protein 4-like [Hibiscus syriacus]KAE8730104.1 putative TPX2 family protein [Hibiscus syriacus]
MANTVLIKAPATFFFFFFFFFGFFIQTKQDNPCPYPCYPPPTGPGGGSGGGGGIVTQTPPASYSPPSQTGVYPPPTGNLPIYTQPPPYGGNSFYGQPPPDPILPYFPFYYRKPPHRTDDQSSGTTVWPGKSMFIITATINLLVFIILLISTLGNY